MVDGRDKQVRLLQGRKTHNETLERAEYSENNLAKTGCSCSSYKCVLMKADEEEMW